MFEKDPTQYHGTDFTIVIIAFIIFCISVLCTLLF